MEADASVMEDRDLITRINEAYAHMSKGRKAIAVYVTEHAQQAAFMTAAELGKAVATSESTVVRFAMYLGYDGYPELQHALALLVQDEMDSIKKIRAHYAKSSDAEVMHTVLLADSDRIRDTAAKMDSAAFQLAVDLILQAEHVYIIGVRSCQPLAGFLHFYLNMIRGNNVLVGTTSTSEMFEQLMRVGSDDVVIGISFPRYSMRTLKCMEFANDRNAHVITLTDSVHSPMNLYSSCNLLAESSNISIVDSLVAPLSLINALVVTLCLKAPDTVRANLKMLEKTWNNYQVYLNDEINFVGEDPFPDHLAKKQGKKINI